MTTPRPQRTAPHLAKRFCANSLLAELSAAPYHLEALCHGESAESPRRWGGPAAASGAVGRRAAGPLSPGGLTSLRKQSSLSLVISWMESKKVKANTARPLQSRPRKKSHKGSSVLPHWSKRVTGPAGIQRLRKTLPPHRKSSTCGQREERSAVSFLEKSIYYPYQFPQILQIHEWR